MTLPLIKSLRRCFLIRRCHRQRLQQLPVVHPQACPSPSDAEPPPNYPGGRTGTLGNVGLIWPCPDSVAANRVYAAYPLLGMQSEATRCPVDRRGGMAAKSARVAVVRLPREPVSVTALRRLEFRDGDLGAFWMENQPERGSIDTASGKERLTIALLRSGLSLLALLLFLHRQLRLVVGRSVLLVPVCHRTTPWFLVRVQFRRSPGGL